MWRPLEYDPHCCIRIFVCSPADDGFAVARVNPDGPTSMAALNLGANCFRMIVADTDMGRFKVIDRVRQMVRLAAGLDQDNKLSDQAHAIAVDCQRYGERSGDFEPASGRVVAAGGIAITALRPNASVPASEPRTLRVLLGIRGKGCYGSSPIGVEYWHQFAIEVAFHARRLLRTPSGAVQKQDLLVG